MRIVNTKLLSHPMNWLIILLMLVIAGMFGHYLLSLLGHEPDGSSKSKLGTYSNNQTGQ